MPTVSVVIPCFNQAQYLAEAIESCLKQTYQDIEIIVVDDGSTDHTGQVAARYPQVQYICQNNGGPASARNTGWRQAKGEYLQFLDADDIILPPKIERCLEAFEQYPETGLVYTDYEVRNSDLTSPYPISLEKVEKLEGLVLRQIVNRVSTFFAPHSPLVRRCLVVEVGGFNETLRGTEDWYLWVNLAAHGVFFRRVSEVLAWYRYTSQGISKNDLQMAYERLKAYEQVTLLNLPTDIIDLDKALAGRHHVLAVKLWQYNRRQEARTHLRKALALQPDGQLSRRLMLYLSYVTDFATANQLLSWLQQKVGRTGTDASSI